MLPVHARSVRYRNIDITGVMPTPPAIKTTPEALSPVKVNLPDGPDTFRTSPTLKVSWMNRDANPIGSRLMESSHASARVGDEASVYDRLIRLPSIIS